MIVKRWMCAIGCLGSIGSCTGKQQSAPPAPPVPETRPGPQPHPAWPALDETFLEASAATFSFRLGKPSPLAITRDGSVLFRRTGPRDRRADLYILEPNGDGRRLTSVDELLSGGTETLSDEERARRERSRTATSGIVDVDRSDDGQRLLIPLGERVFVFDRATGKSQEIEVGEGYPFDPHLSPDGKHVSFVRDGDLWVAGSGAPRRLTQHPEGFEYGVAEFVAQEEFDRRRGYFWSPDSQWIVFQRTDARPVDTLYVSDPAHPDRPPVDFKYPRAGTDNAIVDLGIIAASGSKAAPRWIRWDLERYPYLAHVQWPKAGPLTLQVLNRDQTELSILTVDHATGETKELDRIEDAAWVNLRSGSPSWLDDGSAYLLLREQEDGYALELRSNAGTLVREVLPATFGARTIAGIEPGNRAAIVVASTDPREQHVFRVPLEGQPPEQLTRDGGHHSAEADHGVVVISSSRRDGGSETRAIGADGKVRTLEDLSEKPALVPTTKLEAVEVEGRTHYVAITRPRAFQAGQRYPVLLKVYAGPGNQMVLDVRDTYLSDQFYADAGFIVVRADGRGTPNRGRSWERAILRDLITVPLADQVAVLDLLAKKYAELDRERVGVFGWSFGGYFSTLALLLRPDVFHAAIAGAPVSDWSLYDTAYTERFMKRPVDNPDGYARSSALTHAAALRRPLLLMHGVTDDNVYFAHTLAFIEALYREGKAAEVVALSSTHMLVDPKQALAREKLQIDFFRKHLGPR